MSGKKSNRAKIEKHFDSAQSKNLKSRDLEDPVDIYSHAKIFQTTQQDDLNVEVGIRKIKGTIDDEQFNNKVYSAKKVSRKQLQQSLEQESESDKSESESEESDFKYGKEVNEDDEVSDNDLEKDDDEIITSSLKLAGNGKQSAKNKVVANEGDEEVELALEQLKREEIEESKYTQKRFSSDVQKAKSVKTQKKVFDIFLHQRILLQKVLSQSNKLPSEANFQSFISQRQEMTNPVKACKRNVKAYLKLMSSLQKGLFKVSETSVTVKDIQSTETDKIY